MKFFIEHGEKLVALLFVAFSGWLIYGGLATGGNTNKVDLENYKERIESALRNNKVDPNDRIAQRTNLRERVEASFDRPNQAVKETLASNILYPLPVRPYVDKKYLEADAPKQVKYTESEDLASMKAPGEFAVHASHGIVYVVCVTPSKDIDYKYFTPVRIEYYRGTDEKKVTEKLGEYWIELPPAAKEEGADKEDGGEKTGEATDEEKKKALAEAGLSKSPTLERGMEPKKTKKPKTVAKAPKEGAPKETAAPAEHANDIIFPDHDVEPKTHYYYRARLIGRLQDLGPNSTITNEETHQKIKVKLAEGLSPIPAPAGDKAKYYASEFTPVSGGTVPANFELRFAGKNGTLDDPKTAERFRAYAYEGQFEVKVWIPEVQDWGKDFVWVKPKEELVGAVGYKPKDSPVKQVYKFQTGLKLVEIRTDYEEKPMMTRKPVMEEYEDEDGNKLIRQKRDDSGQPVYIEEPSGNVMRTAIETAVVEEVASGKRENYIKKPAFNPEPVLFMHYDRLLREQEERIRNEKLMLKQQLEKKEGEPKGGEKKTEAPAPAPK